MIKYTKGEWEVLPDGLTIKANIDYEPHYDAESPQTFIAKCFQNGHLGSSKRSTKEDLTNAKLIAAAPNLLTACEMQEDCNILANADIDGNEKVFRKILTKYNCKSSEEVYILQEKICKAAIAKANIGV